MSNLGDPCLTCKKVGYYKYGLCHKCKPRCEICTKFMQGHQAMKSHAECVKKARRVETDGVRGTVSSVYAGVK